MSFRQFDEIKYGCLWDSIQDKKVLFLKRDESLIAKPTFGKCTTFSKYCLSRTHGNSVICWQRYPEWAMDPPN